MSEFLPQSTDKSRTSTNPLNTNIIYEGNATITLTLAAGYYSGSRTITLPLDSQCAGLDIEAWIRFQQSGGGSTVTYQKLPFSAFNTSGVVTAGGYITVTSPAKAGTYDITFTYSTTTAPNVNPTVYYRIKSNRIQPSGMTFV